MGGNDLLNFAAIELGCLVILLFFFGMVAGALGVSLGIWLFCG